MANEKQYLYRVILKDGYYVHNRFEEAKKLYDKEGIKLYAYTKDLKPIHILLYWK